MLEAGRGDAAPSQRGGFKRLRRRQGLALSDELVAEKRRPDRHRETVRDAQGSPHRAVAVSEHLEGSPVASWRTTMKPA